MEPVAWHEPDSYGNVTTYKEWALAHGWKPLYTAPVHASDISQERVDETAKRKHEWVGLTDDEIWDCYTSQGKQFYLAIEAKLKEKNT